MSKSKGSEKIMLETWDFLKPSFQFTKFGTSWSDTAYISCRCVCVCGGVYVCVHRKSKKWTGIPWTQPVVDIGFNSVHYQVRPTKITIMAEWFYENRHGTRQAHGCGA